MAKRELVIHLAAGAVRHGIWCDRCLTGAGYEVEMHRLTNDGPRPITTIRGCVRCKADEEEDVF